MSDTITDLKDLGAATSQEVAAPKYEQEIDAQGRSYATGKRKNAVARVWLKPGSGKVTVNGRDQDTYFARPVLRMILRQPFEVANRKNQYDVVATVVGGGLSGQAGAVRHGISKALTRASSSARSTARPRPAAASSSPSAKRTGQSSKWGLPRWREALFLCVTVMRLISPGVAPRFRAIQARTDP